MSIEAIERIQVEARIPAKVEQLKSVYNARSIVSDPEFGKTVFLQPCMDPVTGERCPMLGNMAVPCRKGNGLIDVGLSTVYCPDTSRSGVLKVIKL